MYKFVPFGSISRMKKTLYPYIIVLFFCCLATPSQLNAQKSGTFIDRLQSLRIEVNGEWDSDPVMLLAERQWLEISFDDLQHDYVRYTYTITHCNADWTQSELLESDYMIGFNGSRIEDYEPSKGTAMLYNHYSLRIPNENVQRLLVSGNYRVDIREDGDDTPIATACFSIVDPKVGITIEPTSNTDLDAYDSHQQVNFSVNYSTYKIDHPEQDLHYTVLQNGRWDNSVTTLQHPTYVRNHELIFIHNRSLIFPAGNEWRRMEILDDNVPTMRIDSMTLEGNLYNAYVMPDQQRTSYLYDQDQNGRTYIRNDEDVESTSESEYYITHFRLDMPEVYGGSLYLCGQFSNGLFDERHRMEYDVLAHAYQIQLPLKQGSYNYMYLFVPDGTTCGQTAPSEGDFYQTENEYAIYVYHRPFGERYDHLIGYQKVKYLGDK